MTFVEGDEHNICLTSFICDMGKFTCMYQFLNFNVIPSVLTKGKKTNGNIILFGKLVLVYSFPASACRWVQGEPMCLSSQNASCSCCPLQLLKSLTQHTHTILLARQGNIRVELPSFPGLGIPSKKFCMLHNTAHSHHAPSPCTAPHPNLPNPAD